MRVVLTRSVRSLSNREKPDLLRLRLTASDPNGRDPGFDGSTIARSIVAESLRELTQPV